jgi:hypothetical protein
MPRIKHLKIMRVHSIRVKRMVNDKRFLRRLSYLSTIHIDKNYDIPYVAGYSKDARIVFIDRHLNTKMDKVDVTLCIVMHEIVEKALLDIFNLTYAQAHHIATYIEHEYATKHNINWKKYIKFLDPQMKHIGHEKVKKIPKSLDLEPYEDEKDFELLKRMKLHAR